MFSKTILVVFVAASTPLAFADDSSHDTAVTSVVFVPRGEDRAPARPAINVDQLFKDQSIVRDDGQRIRIESWRKDAQGFEVIGRNSSNELTIVRVPVMEIGGYANFFGALFMFDGEGFQKITRQNAHELKFTKRYHASAAY